MEKPVDFFSSLNQLQNACVNLRCYRVDYDSFLKNAGMDSVKVDYCLRRSLWSYRLSACDNFKPQLQLAVEVLNCENFVDKRKTKDDFWTHWTAARPFVCFQVSTRVLVNWTVYLEIKKIKLFYIL